MDRTRITKVGVGTSLVDSDFGVPDTPRDVHQSTPPPSPAFATDGDATGLGGAPDTDVEWANSELHTIASTIEELQGRLAQANARLSSATKVETTEIEIGRLFVEAQQFSDDALARLEVQVHEILREAESKAKQILAEATAEAQEMRRLAQHSEHASTQAAQDLQSAIAGFTTVNAALLQELGALNATLTPAKETLVSGIDPFPVGSRDVRQEYVNAGGARQTTSTGNG